MPGIGLCERILAVVRMIQRNLVMAEGNLEPVPTSAAARNIY
jgi:hypothetical protein